MELDRLYSEYVYVELHASVLFVALSHHEQTNFIDRKIWL